MGKELRYDTVRVRTQSSPSSFPVLYQGGKKIFCFARIFMPFFRKILVDEERARK